MTDFILFDRLCSVEKLCRVKEFSDDKTGHDQYHVPLFFFQYSNAYAFSCIISSYFPRISLESPSLMSELIGCAISL